MKRRSRVEEESQSKSWGKEEEEEEEKGGIWQENGKELDSGKNREIRDKERRRWFIIGGVKYGELAVRWDMEPGPSASLWL